SDTFLATLPSALILPDFKLIFPMLLMSLFDSFAAATISFAGDPSRTAILDLIPSSFILDAVLSSIVFAPSSSTLLSSAFASLSDLLLPINDSRTLGGAYRSSTTYSSRISEPNILANLIDSSTAFSDISEPSCGTRIVEYFNAQIARQDLFN